MEEGGRQRWRVGERQAWVGGGLKDRRVPTAGADGGTKEALPFHVARKSKLSMLGLKGKSYRHEMVRLRRMLPATESPT